MIQVSIKAEVKDKSGRTLSSERHPSDSFVRGWNHLICAQMMGETDPTPNITTKNTDGNDRSLMYCQTALRCSAAIGVTDYGIRIGTDNTPVDIEQWALIAPITEGVGGGQMEHRAVTFNDLGVVGNVCSFEVERIIDNNSGGAIHVLEAAIYIVGLKEGFPLQYFCGARDLIDLNVLDGASITVTYTIRVVA